MASYTIEDIEYIRRKSGISYQEAIALLDYHNGDVMRALVDLERNGKLGDSARAAAEHQPAAEDYKERAARRGGFLSTRLVITGSGRVVANVSIIFVIIASLVSFWLVIGALIACVFLGYRISISTVSDENNEKLDRMVRGAADNVKRTASSIAHNVNAAIEHRQAQRQPQPQPKETVADLDAKEDGQPAEEPAPGSPEAFVRDLEELERHDVPTIQVPVKVESTDGSVVCTTDGDGYSTATIE